jgi:hypothetical protein
MNLKSLAKFWASTARFVDFGVFTQKVQSWSKLKNFLEEILSLAHPITTSKNQWNSTFLHFH